MIITRPALEDAQDAAHEAAGIIIISLADCALEFLSQVHGGNKETERMLFDLSVSLKLARSRLETVSELLSFVPEDRRA